MAVHKTDWHLGAAVAESTEDPFADAEPVERVGMPIRLDDDEAVLHARLEELIDSEAALADRDVTCPIKGLAESCCSACPVSQDGTDGPLHNLCRVAKAQERTVMQIAALQAGVASGQRT